MGFGSYIYLLQYITYSYQNQYLQKIAKRFCNGNMYISHIWKAYNFLKLFKS